MAEIRQFLLGDMVPGQQYIQDAGVALAEGKADPGEKMCIRDRLISLNSGSSIILRYPLYL